MTKYAIALNQPTLLEQVLAYEHPGLIERIQEKMHMSKDDAQKLFNDTKQFLFLCGISPQRLAPPELIDECWHHFILFTKGYARFCESYFGRFIHHSPKTAAERQVADGTTWARTLGLAVSTFGAKCLSANWNYVNDGKCEGSTNCQDSEYDPPDK